MARSWKRLERRHAGLLILAALGFGSSGCLAAAAGAAGGAALGFAYYKGEVFDRFAASYPETVAATRAALKDLGMPVIKETTHTSSTTIESRTREDIVVWISVTSEASKNPGEVFTQVGVRVGLFGDGKLCTQLFDRMDVHFGSGDRLTPQAQPAVGPIQPVAAAGPAPQTPPPPLAAK
jgi:hypothetical protein